MNNIICLSIGESRDLNRLGYGLGHVDELLVNLARLVFKAGMRLAYGGRLHSKSDPSSTNKLMRPLIDAALAYAGSLNPTEGPVATPEAPLISYQRYPYTGLTPDYEASLYHVCEFVRVRADGTQDAPSGSQKVVDKARTLTELRRQTVNGDGTRPRASLSIALGGKLEDFSGTMPGIAEEYLEARRAGCPVLLSSKFGGCSGLIVDYLLGNGAFPEMLTLEAHQSRASFKPLIEAEAELGLQSRYTHLKKQMDEDRALLGRNERLVPGIDNGDLSKLMSSQSDSVLIRGVGGILAHIAHASRLRE